MRGKPRGGQQHLKQPLRKTRCRKLRGQSPLFQDLADKRLPGNPIIEANMFVSQTLGSFRKKG